MATHSIILAENSMDRGGWYVIVHGVTKNQTLQSTHTHTQVSKRGLWAVGLV